MKRVIKMFYCFLIKKKNLILSLSVIAVILCSLIVFASKESNEEKNGIKVPIIMYHSISENSSRWGKYVVSPETIENDLTYLKENGYETVVLQDLIDYVYKGDELPEKPVILSFDDGYYNNMVYLPEILEKYDSKATIAVVGEFTDRFSQADDHNVNYSHLTWDDLKEMSENKHFEITNHSYNMHSSDKRVGCFKLKSESDEEYEENLTNDIEKMQNALKEKADIDCNVFTYPYGKIADASVEIIKKTGIKASLSCYEKISTVTKDRDSLYLLGRFNRPYNISTQSFMKKAGI